MLICQTVLGYGHDSLEILKTSGGVRVTIRRIGGGFREADGEAGRGRRRPPLDRDLVVRAALDVLDEVGLDGLTMRRLADKLGVKAASLYWHVRNKEELLGLLADAIAAGVREPRPGMSWREQLETLAWENRRVLLAHRDAARILAGTPPAGANRLRLAEITLRALLKAGLDHRDATYAAILLTDYATGFVAEEAMLANAAQSQGVSMDELLAGIRAQFKALPAEEYPSMVTLADDLTDPDADPRFRFGLEVLLDGLERRLAKTGRS
jgi:AcrR family transcriptional regulator